MFGYYTKLDRTYTVYICRQCGQYKLLSVGDSLKEESSGIQPCWMCNSTSFLATDLLPSEAERARKEHRWIPILHQYFSPEEVEQMINHSGARIPEIPPNDSDRKSPPAHNPYANKSHVPTCPTCHSQKVEKISALNRAISISTWGIFSSKINKQFVCKNCGYKW